jgi:hypothetical protein
LDKHLKLLTFLRKNARKKNTPVHFRPTASSRGGLLPGHPAFFYAASFFNASIISTSCLLTPRMIIPNPGARQGDDQSPVIDWL